MRPDANAGNTNNMLPSSPDAPNLDYFSLADDLAKAADSAKWPPGVRDLEKVAELTIAFGYYLAEDLLDTFTAERSHICNLLMESRGGYARALRKILEAKSPPQVQVKRQCDFREVGFSSNSGRGDT